jgi:phosphatidyl-myo-inositol alpha-mannosyltransferase
MLRVGICAPYDLARAGGVNSHIRAQARALRRRGHAITIFGAASAPLEDGEIAVSGCVSFVVHGTETGIGVDPRAWSRVGRLLERERFDVLHVHEPLMPVAPWCATLRSSVPIVGTFHTHREDGHPFYPWSRALLEPLMRRVTRRIAVSDAARRTVARYFPGDYEVVPNGIDVARFHASARRQRERSDDRRQVLYVGRLEPRKGVEHLIDAIAIAERQIPDLRLAIVGDGPDRDALTARARDARVDACFAGAVTDDQLPAYYHAADLVCSPATGGESFGIVLLEAMAAGRPVVATAIDGYVELVGDVGSGARLVAPGDAGALARELIALLADAPLRARLGAEGARFAARFDWDVVARQVETIYLDALRSSSPGFQTRSCSIR